MRRWIAPLLALLLPSLAFGAIKGGDTRFIGYGNTYEAVCASGTGTPATIDTFMVDATGIRWFVPATTCTTFCRILSSGAAGDTVTAAVDFSTNYNPTTGFGTWTTDSSYGTMQLVATASTTKSPTNLTTYYRVRITRDFPGNAYRLSFVWPGIERRR